MDEGLQKIIEKCGPAPWRPIDVRRSVEHARAALFACEDGFFIIERNQDWGAFYLNVWCMYFRPGKGWRRRAALIAQLDAIKKEQLCEFISFTSPRGEWNAMVHKYFKLHAHIFRRE